MYFIIHLDDITPPLIIFSITQKNNPDDYLSFSIILNSNPTWQIYKIFAACLLLMYPQPPDTHMNTHTILLPVIQSFGPCSPPPLRCWQV